MRVDEISAGMELAKDVYDPHGCVLVRAGVKVTERHIKAFKSWGILEVTVQSEEGSTIFTEPDSKTEQEMRELLDTQFGLSNRDHPAVETLYQLCLARALARP